MRQPFAYQRCQRFFGMANLIAHQLVVFELDRIIVPPAPQEQFTAARKLRGVNQLYRNFRAVILCREHAHSAFTVAT